MRQQPRSQIVKLVAAVVLLTGLAAGCSGSKTPTSTGTASTRPLAASSSPEVTPTPGGTPSAKVADASGLSGTWKGKYSGVDTGTFILNWTQSGTRLHGTIGLSGSRDIPLTGIVHGNTITFGTVGTSAITYSGTVSGNSMSGTYRVNGSAGGPWSATKV